MEKGGEFAGWALASTSVPPRPCARRPPPAISIGLPGFTCQAARCRGRIQQPAALAAAPSQLLPGEEWSGAAGRQPAGTGFKVSSPRCRRCRFPPGTRHRPQRRSRTTPERSVGRCERGPMGFTPGCHRDLGPWRALGELSASVWGCWGLGAG